MEETDGMQTMVLIQVMMLWECRYLIVCKIVG